MTWITRIAAAAIIALLGSCTEEAERARAVEGPSDARVADALPPLAPPPPEPPPPGAAPPASGYQNYYSSRFGVGEAEGQRRTANEAHISSLARDLRLNPPAGFSDIWIEHEPDYRVVIAFKGSPDKAAILSRADPALRGDIVFRSAERDRAEIERDTDRIIAAFQGMPGPWAGGYDVKTGKFVFDVGSEAGVAYAERNLPPDLDDDVIVRVGPVPVPLAR